MNRQTLIDLLEQKRRTVNKAVIVSIIIIAAILGVAYYFDILILVRLCLFSICIPLLCYLWWRFMPSLMMSPGTFLSSSSAKLLRDDSSPVIWMYLLQLTQTQYSSTVRVEKDLVIGLKNKKLLKINYSSKSYQLADNVTFDIEELSQFVETQLLSKDGRIGFDQENARWFSSL
jgi:hypothetical protein